MSSQLAEPNQRYAVLASILCAACGQTRRYDGVLGCSRAGDHNEHVLGA